MKSIKRYLNIALVITFCASIDTFSMEKEKSNSSGGSSETPLGEANTSHEIHPRKKALFEERINRLRDLNKKINRTLVDNYDISTELRKELEDLKEEIYKTYEKANDMLLVVTSDDMRLINQEVNAIVKKWKSLKTQVKIH